MLRIALLASLSVGTLQAESRVDFVRDVRPILSNACFQCHGPDDGQRKADLRLDQRAGLFTERDGGAPVAAGKPDESELFLRITSDDPALVMPPPKSGKTLTPAQRETIRRWIAEGAEYNEHWAFRAPVRPAVPAVRRADWVKNPIDAFVLARLEREGISPNETADPATLFRRLHLDLVGLPPRPAEAAAWQAAPGEAQYAELVERLLESPHFGERWARVWLDAARYADSDGYEKDKQRWVWAYRDWVIQAFHTDLPYDEFLVQQIAGDLLPEAGPEARIATGFLRNSMINEEGGVDPEQFRMEAMFDRMDAIGKGMLGLTIQCAQCHNHKYDPLTQEEYYRMFAFLNECHEASIAVYTPEEQIVRNGLMQQIRALEAELQRQKPDWPEAMAAWEDSVRERKGQWTTLQTTEDDPSGGQKMYRMKDGSYLCQGYAPTKHTTVVTVTCDLPAIAAFRLEQLNDPNLPLGGPGRSIHGTSALTEFKVKATPLARPDQGAWVKFVSATANANPEKQPLDRIYDDKSNKERFIGPVEFAIDGNNETAWGTDIGPGRSNQPCEAVFVPEQPLAAPAAEEAGENAPAGFTLEFHLVQNHGGWNSDDNQNHNLGRFRLSVTGDSGVRADPVPAAVRRVLEIPREQRTPAQQAAVFEAWRKTVPEWAEANRRIEELWKQHPRGTSQLVLAAREEMRGTRLLERGDFLKPTRAVEGGVPAFLHPLPESDDPPRLRFARWIADRQSPTVARSIVNRIWQGYFGTGLVATPEDFGSQGEAPSHPELLDWLAVELMDNGWRLKTIHRLIVTSQTYRLAARATPELQARDPYNRLLARGARFRLDAELVRDTALAASGLLNPKVGGLSVFPDAPEFLFQPPASYGPKVWDQAKDDSRYRRGIYTFRYRSVPYPALQAFDAPNGDFSCVRRPRSNTPLQALTTLNEPLFVDCARQLARRVLKEETGGDAARIAHLFRLCVAREPHAGEREVLQKLLDAQRARFAGGAADPMPLAVGERTAKELPEGVPAAEAAAWTVVARVVLNLDETITRE